MAMAERTPREAASSRFACLSFRDLLIVQLSHFPQNEIEQIRQTIAAIMRIVDEERVGNAIRLVIGRRSGVTDWAFVCPVLAALYEMGWVLQNFSNFGEKKGERGSLIFKKEESRLPEVYWVTLTISSANVVKLQNPPEELRARVVSSLGQFMKKKTSGHGRIEKRPDVYALVLDGKPWLPRNRNESAYGKEVMLRIMGALDACGYRVYASIDLKATPEWPFGTMLAGEECDIWCCCRPAHDSDEGEVSMEG